MENHTHFNSEQLTIEALRYFRIIFKSANQHFHEVEKQAGIGGASLWALSEISSNNLTVNGLAKAMSIHQSTASNLLEKLEVAGLVKRTRSDVDRRVVYLEITDKGNQILQKAPLPHKGVLPDALSKLDQIQLESLILILTDLTNKISEKQKSKAYEPLGNI
jgi:DNA-binding MarR family transcriptional regulator